MFPLTRKNGNAGCVMTVLEFREKAWVFWPEGLSQDGMVGAAFVTTRGRLNE